jgi:hypothetical protein
MAKKQVRTYSGVNLDSPGGSPYRMDIGPDGSWGGPYNYEDYPSSGYSGEDDKAKSKELEEKCKNLEEEIKFIKAQRDIILHTTVRSEAGTLQERVSELAKVLDAEGALLRFNDSRSFANPEDYVTAITDYLDSKNNNTERPGFFKRMMGYLKAKKKE